MSVERFSPPPKIGEVVKLLRSSQGWKAILDLDEFISVEPVAESGHKPSEKQIHSMLVGNPTHRLPTGEVCTIYDPQWLLETVQAVASFRDRHRRLLNAMKHGFRLPKYSDLSIDAVAAGFREADQSFLMKSNETRKVVRKGALEPSFWYLETELGASAEVKNLEEPTAELRLYAIDFHRTLRHAQLMLELLRLLFDATRDSVRLDQAHAEIGKPLFQGIIEITLRVLIPLRQPPDDEPHVVSAYVSKG